MDAQMSDHVLSSGANSPDVTAEQPGVATTTPGAAKRPGSKLNAQQRVKEAVKRQREAETKARALEAALEEAQKPKEIPLEILAANMEKIRARYPDIDRALAIAGEHVNDTIFPALLATDVRAAYCYVTGCAVLVGQEQEKQARERELSIVDHYRHLQAEHFKVN